mmetsp:Transcript_68626/g.146942  ORF Transcript_68626/g.146942 Transcript_68626/m.146942 type:complete len:342 (+) Transcript_68626:105-1130(+)|eukprot:CAMPEP_0180457876 /NCGR_PEP_ID=MMETSP1036_2-20121128/22052_1 /TAXON_ID=632150 /ORGANISM="Azadinium spinosum, Strain 3D9" /LENGTH=341 /DNA_ID=CAMNT_0022464505 /DNA_START=74 /DNA_END=1099 /DNA_ORIENTATION=-
MEALHTRLWATVYIFCATCAQVAGVRTSAETSSQLQWSRAELASKLAKSGAIGDVFLSPYSEKTDGLLWTGSSWFPGKVFAEGFKKTPRRAELDPGDNLRAWGEQIADSIIGNNWAYGFHMTVNPRVAAQFSAFHVARMKSPDSVAEDECDFYDTECNLGVMETYRSKYGCPAEDSPVMKVDANCYGGPCIRIDKLADPDEGVENLCPNWGYAYLVRSEGVHVRVSTSDALGKDYSAEEEVFVPYGVEPKDILGAIPIYTRKPDGYIKNPGLTRFSENWKLFSKVTVPGFHTKDGKGTESGIGDFIYNPNYEGDAKTDVANELAKKHIDSDLGTAIPREVA